MNIDWVNVASAIGSWISALASAGAGIYAYRSGANAMKAAKYAEERAEASQARLELELHSSAVDGLMLALAQVLLATDQMRLAGRSAHSNVRSRFVTHAGQNASRQRMYESMIDSEMKEVEDMVAAVQKEYPYDEDAYEGQQVREINRCKRRVIEVREAVHAKLLRINAIGEGKL